ncbi:MAG TPA: glycosyltransferase family 4 protein [Candidatus Moranbacteria bacterium]|nr:glycosyltransferase family 4 protein [Candidatus Moranbacteria bacterium]
MKIAFLGQKGIPAKSNGVEKHMEEVAIRLTKKGHEVFLFPPLLRALFQNFDVIHFPFSFSKTFIFFISIFKRKTACIRIKIPQGVDVSYDENSEYLKKFNLQKGSYILSSGRLNKKSGIHNLILAFKNLEDKHLSREKKLIIIGNGSSKDEYFKELKDCARGRENIIFVADQTDEISRQLFSHAYCFVESSESEKTPFALLEAMGYGKAVLSRGTKKNIEALRDEAGLIFRLDNAHDLEEKLVFLINNPVIAKKIGEKAMFKAKMEFSWEKITNQIETAYEDAILQKGKVLNKSYERNI